MPSSSDAERGLATPGSRSVRGGSTSGRTSSTDDEPVSPPRTPVPRAPRRSLALLSPMPDSSATETTPLLGSPLSSSFSITAALRKKTTTPTQTKMPTKKKRRRPKNARSDSSRSHLRRRRAPPIFVLPALLMLLLAAAAGFAAWNMTLGECRVKWLCKALGAAERLDEVWGRNAGTYAPFVSRGKGTNVPLPKGCKVDQVSILHRHTSRFPTPDAGARLKVTLAKIANRTNRAPNNRADFSFLTSYDMELTGWKFGQLTDQGRRAAWDSGRSYTKRYPHLELFTRTTDKARVAESTRFWLEGFHRGAFNSSAPLRRPNVTMPEGPTANNTLSVHSCGAFEQLDPPAGYAEYMQIVRRLQPAADRLNGVLDPQPPLDVHDVVRLAGLCGLDSTVASSSRTDGTWSWSRWCRVLNRDEWEIAGYVADVERWYRVGDGGRYGHIMGAGYVNELLARLHDTQPVDRTTVNRTLAADPATFPRGGQRLFVDFSHDNEMVEILAALGLRKLRKKLPLGHLIKHPKKRRFVLAQLVPFGAQWAFERVVCSDGTGSSPHPDSYADMYDADSSTDTMPTEDLEAAGYPTKRPPNRRHEPKPKPPPPPKNKTYVRVLINDKPTHVDHMACRSSPHHDHHMCELSAFVESQIWSREDVDWADCAVTAGGL